MSHLFPNYGRFDIEISSGSGSVVTDKEGKSYLDFTSGIAVCSLGHCNEKVTNALVEQANTVWHTSNLFTSSLQEEVATKLCVATNLGAAFFCNSGAEANEAAIKLARKATGKKKIITFKNSFHGRTIATLSATGQSKVQDGFFPLTDSFAYAAYGDIHSVQNLIDENTAAIMLEVVQGEGGVLIGDATFLEEVQQLCETSNILLIIDEIQTGMGRTAKPFGFQHFNLSPDIITIAKALGNGIPVGAMLAKEKYKSIFSPGTHGSTFGGNPLAMSVAKVVCAEIFQTTFLQECQEKGEYFLQKLTNWSKKCGDVKEVRGIGLMIGIEFTTDCKELVLALQKEGLIVLQAGPNVMRILPPLTVSYEEIDQAVSIIEKQLVFI